MGNGIMSVSVSAGMYVWFREGIFDQGRHLAVDASRIKKYPRARQSTAALVRGCIKSGRA
jgi:hypothetical protein